MDTNELLKKLITSGTRSIILETPSPMETRQQLKEILKQLYCSNIISESCNECRDCKRINKLEDNIHPDLWYYSGQLFSIAQARELVTKVASRPLELPSRYVILAAEKYSPEAQNACLKLLEEDFSFEARTQFLFIVRSRNELVRTIVSRSVIWTARISGNYFADLVQSKKFNKVQFVTFLTNKKETSLAKAEFIRDRQSLNIESLQEAVAKAYNPKTICPDIFSAIETMKAFPFQFIYKAIEFTYLLSPEKAPWRADFYTAYWKSNGNRSKFGRDNLNVLNEIWFFLNKHSKWTKHFQAFLDSKQLE